LIEKGYQVIVVDDLSSGNKENLNSKAQFYNISILDNDLENVFKKENQSMFFILLLKRVLMNQ